MKKKGHSTATRSISFPTFLTAEEPASLVTLLLWDLGKALGAFFSRVGEFCSLCSCPVGHEWSERKLILGD
jgi:hypothetical protein